LTNHGSLTFKFAADGAGHYPSKIDFHQVDGGFGGHMWSAHAWNGKNSANTKHLVTGTWTLDRQLNGWARVLVYVPDHRARTPQAFYTVIQNRLYQVLVLGALILNARHIIARLTEPEVVR